MRRHDFAVGVTLDAVAGNMGTVCPAIAEVPVNFDALLAQLGSSGVVDRNTIRLVAVRPETGNRAVPVQYSPAPRERSGSTQVRPPLGGVWEIPSGLEQVGAKSPGQVGVLTLPVGGESGLLAGERPELHFSIFDGAIGWEIPGLPRDLRVFEQNGRRPEAADFPSVEVWQEPDQRLQFALHGQPVTTYHFGDRHHHPFLFPVLGPGGVPVAAFGHPWDMVGHRHHTGFWVGHASVNGLDYWTDRPAAGRLVHRVFASTEQGAVFARATALVDWRATDGQTVLEEERVMRLYDAGEHALLMDIELRLSPAGSDVTLGETPFGFVAFRVARPMGAAEGGGVVENEFGKANEEDMMWHRSRWCSYAGPAAPGRTYQVTLFDHPDNPDHPVRWHVRRDGWMGASFTQAGAYTIGAGESLRLCYRMLVTDRPLEHGEIEATWSSFGRLLQLSLGAIRQITPPEGVLHQPQ